MILNLDNRQLAFLCAATHFWQRAGASVASQDLERATDSGSFPVLSQPEILALANKLAMTRSLGRETSSEAHSLADTDATSDPDTSGRKPLAINLSDVDWIDHSPEGAKPRSRLTTIIKFNKVSHHLDAIEVRFGRGYRDQVAVAEACHHQLERYHRSDIDPAPFQTVFLDGRRYVLFATPFSY